MKPDSTDVRSADGCVRNLREENGGDLDLGLDLPNEQLDADYIARLMSSPIRLEGFVPLKRSEIYQCGVDKATKA